MRYAGFVYKNVRLLLALLFFCTTGLFSFDTCQDNKKTLQGFITHIGFITQLLEGQEKDLFFKEKIDKDYQQKYENSLKYLNQFKEYLKDIFDEYQEVDERNEQLNQPINVKNYRNKSISYFELVEKLEIISNILRSAIGPVREKNREVVQKKIDELYAHVIDVRYSQENIQEYKNIVLGRIISYQESIQDTSVQDFAYIKYILENNDSYFIKLLNIPGFDTLLNGIKEATLRRNQQGFLYELSSNVFLQATKNVTIQAIGADLAFYVKESDEERFKQKFNFTEKKYKNCVSGTEESSFSLEFDIIGADYLYECKSFKQIPDENTFGEMKSQAARYRYLLDNINDITRVFYASVINTPLEKMLSHDPKDFFRLFNQETRSYDSKKMAYVAPFNKNNNLNSIFKDYLKKNNIELIDHVASLVIDQRPPLSPMVNPDNNRSIEVKPIKSRSREASPAGQHGTLGRRRRKSSENDDDSRLLSPQSVVVPSQFGFN